MRMNNGGLENIRVKEDLYKNRNLSNNSKNNIWNLLYQQLSYKSLKIYELFDQ